MNSSGLVAVKDEAEVLALAAPAFGLEEDNANCHTTRKSTASIDSLKFKR